MYRLHKLLRTTQAVALCCSVLGFLQASQLTQLTQQLEKVIFCMISKHN